MAMTPTSHMRRIKLIGKAENWARLIKAAEDER